MSSSFPASPDSELGDSIGTLWHFCPRKSPSLIETKSRISNTWPISQERHSFISLKMDQTIIIYLKPTQVWWHILVILPLKSQGRKIIINSGQLGLHSKFQANLCPRVRPSLKICVCVCVVYKVNTKLSKPCMEKERWSENSQKRKCK